MLDTQHILLASWFLTSCPSTCSWSNRHSLLDWQEPDMFGTESKFLKACFCPRQHSWGLIQDHLILPLDQTCHQKINRFSRTKVWRLKVWSLSATSRLWEPLRLILYHSRDPTISSQTYFGLFRQKSCVDEPQDGLDVVPNQRGEADLQLQLAEVKTLPPGNKVTEINN